MRFAWLAGGAVAAAAAIALWFGGVGSLLFAPARSASPTGASATTGASAAAVPSAGAPSTEAGTSAVAREELADAVRLARRGTGDPRVPAMLAAIVASASAAGEPRTAGDRFVAFDLLVDAPDGVDGLVVDLSIADPRGVIVGLESGDAPFAEPPTYDADRLARGEVRIASISGAASVGRVRVATISLRCDAADPGVDATLVSAVRERGGAVADAPVELIVLPRSAP